MKNILAFLGKSCKWILIVIGFALLAAVLTVLAMWLGWPIFSGVAATAALTGVLLLAFAVRQIVRWRDKKHFVSQVLAKDTFENTVADKSMLSGIREAWQFGVMVLKRSPLGRTGNPLHALPWVVVLGSQDSGKTALVGTTHRVRPVGQGTEYTENAPLRWSFLPEVVVLETHGKFTAPIDNTTGVAEEWETFLALLSAERGREALNGIVLTVSVDQLLSLSPTALHEFATRLRNRVQQLMLVLGMVFPVYVVVTKIDKLPGMAGLLSRFPGGDLEKVLGRRNSVEHPLEAEFFARETLRAAEHDLRAYIELHAAYGHGPQGDDLEALFALRELGERLVLFTESVFRRNPHQSSAMLRGLFFTSVLDASQAGEERVCFVNELFGAMIPADRYLRKELVSFQSARSRVYALCLGAWYVTLLGLCGLFAVNTVYQWNGFVTKNSVQASANRPAKDGLSRLYLQNERVIDIDKTRRSWLLPVMGLDRLSDLEAYEKALYVKWFEEDQLKPFLAQVDGYHTKKLNSTEQFLLMQRLFWLSTALNTRILRGNALDMRDKPYPVPMGSDVGKVMQGGQSQPGKGKTWGDAGRDLWTISFGHLFLQYLDWTQDAKALNLLKLQVEERSLVTLGMSKAKDFDWLVKGVSENLFLEPVTLLDVTGTFVQGGKGVAVPPAYTLEGYRIIRDLTSGLLEATGENAQVASRLERFYKQYYKDYAEVWRQFANGLDGIWHDTIYSNSLIEATNPKRLRTMPQLLMIKRMAHELQPLMRAKTAPRWVEGVILSNAVLGLALELELANEEDKEISTLDFLYATFTSSDSNLIKIYHVLGLNIQQARGMVQSIQNSFKFFVDLKSVAKVIASPESALALARIHYGGAAFGDAKTSPFTSAQERIGQMLTPLLTEIGQREVVQACLNNLYQFYAYALTVQAASLLEKQWESDVAAAAMVLPTNEAQRGVFGEKGVVTRYLETGAKPFLARALGQYKAETWGTHIFPWTDDFLTYIQEGQVSAASPPPDSYGINVRSQPTSVNVDAREKPEATVLTLECQSGITTLENRNYPKRQTFTYVPGKCGAAKLEVQFSAVKLELAYNSFVDFLDDFSYGERVFRVADFPDKLAALNSLGVREITVRMLPDNTQNVLRQPASAPAMPERITYTW